MYAGEDGEVCVELGYVGKEISVSKGNQPDKSKAGGWPAWFGEAPVDVSDLVCRLCGRCLYLVAQIYAPTHVQRSLCVFGCNRAACSLRPEGWRAIRTQEGPPCADPPRDHTDPTDINGVVGGAGEKLPPTPPVPAQAVVEPAPAPDPWGASGVSWGAAAPDGDEWGAEVSEWGAGVGAERVGAEATPDIVALLDEQEKRSSKTQQDGEAAAVAAATAAAAAAEPLEDGGACDQSARAEPQPNGCSDRRRGPARAPGAAAVAPAAVSSAAKAELGGGRPRFPAKPVSFMPEPWGAGSSGADDKDMEKRLRRYREQEEDRGLVAALDQALGLKAGGGGGENGGHQAGGGGVAGVGEKYESTPARAKAVMRFADRVARSPRQVVRYAYGGQPLWSASDPPKVDVPLCACGATRLFEMQLMPALLLQLQANALAGQDTPEQDGPSSSGSNEAHDDDLAKSAPGRAPPLSVTHQAGGGESTPSADDGVDPAGAAQAGGGGETTGGAGNEDGEREEGGATAMPTPSEEDRERLRTWGMDWGVVGVWSCPTSCDVSCEESVVVQLPV